eukprot:1872850-Pyramimonas_sp.AAC.1
MTSDASCRSWWTQTSDLQLLMTFRSQIWLPNEGIGTGQLSMLWSLQWREGAPRWSGRPSEAMAPLRPPGPRDLSLIHI